MKKSTYLLFAAAGLLLATSCARGTDEFAAGEEGVVTIQAQLPAEFATRAIGDGSTATTLTYAVYDNAKTEPVVFAEDEVTFTNNTAKLTLRLATGHTYDIVFWADAADNSFYTFDENAKTITVSYEGATANDESRDAFFGQIADLEVTGAINQTVTLTRPFAQLNLGTDDAEAAAALGITIAQSSVKVTNVCTTLNLLDGTASGAQEATFAMNAVPTGLLTVGEKTYGYLGMNYVLVPAADAGDVLTDCTIVLNDGADLPEIALSNVPLKRNYRTNILGSLITSPSVFTINIDEAFAGDLEFEVVNTTEDLIQAMAEGGKYILSQDLALTNGYPRITKDLEMDLGGKTLTLGAAGTFNPQANVTFSNGIIEANNLPGTSGAIGVGAGKTATLENVEFTTSGAAVFPASDANVVIKNSTISAPFFAVSTNASTAVAGDAPVNITIEGSTLSGSSPVFINIPCTLTMTDVTVNGTMHGVVMRGGTAVIDGCTVTLTYSEDAAEDNAQSMANYFTSRNWGQGNMVNLAALTVGNKVPDSSTSYQYPTNVTITNSTFQSAGKYAALFPALYGWANRGADKGVTIVYDDATTFTNGTDTPIVFGSDNITVNGTPVTL